MNCWAGGSKRCKLCPTVALRKQTRWYLAAVACGLAALALAIALGAS